MVGKNPDKQFLIWILLFISSETKLSSFFGSLLFICSASFIVIIGLNEIVYIVNKCEVLSLNCDFRRMYVQFIYKTKYLHNIKIVV